MIELNLNGNLWDRLVAAWFLVFRSKDFLDGITDAIIKRFVQEVEDFTNLQRALRGDLDPAPEAMPELAETAAIAAQEALNG